MRIGEYEFPFRYGQERLAELCADYPRDLSAGYMGNNGFGITRLFKRYAELPEDYPVRFAIEHGVKFNEGEIPFPLIGHFKTILVPSLETVKIPGPESGRTVEATGFGFLYAKHLYDQEFGPPSEFQERRGTLFFPMKSMRLTHIETDHAALARELRELPERFQPVVVCIFFVDYEKGKHLPYQDAGLPVVTAGNRHDPEFLFRLYDLCRPFRYAASNDVATNLCVSVKSGCRFFLIKGPGCTRTIEPRKEEVDSRTGETFERNVAEGWRLFGEPGDEPTPEQLAFADRFLGTASFRSPRGLRRIMLRAHRREEGRPFWHGRCSLIRPPDAGDFDFSIPAPGEGWHGITKKDDLHYRWTGPGRESWLELYSGMRGDAILRFRIHSFLEMRIVEGLEVTVNGIAVSPLTRTIVEGAGMDVEGRTGEIERGVVRIGFRVPETLRLCDVKPGKTEDRPQGIAISRISLTKA